MLIWFDRELPMPRSYDVRCESARAALNLLRTGRVTGISIGYDEQSRGTESLALAMLVENMAATGQISRFPWSIHSQPNRLRATEQALQLAEKHWDEREDPRCHGLAVTPSGRLIAYPS
jgi:hypothetical protein